MMTVGRSRMAVSTASVLPPVSLYIVRGPPSSLVCIPFSTMMSTPFPGRPVAPGYGLSYASCVPASAMIPFLNASMASSVHPVSTFMMMWCVHMLRASMALPTSISCMLRSFANSRLMSPTHARGVRFAGKHTLLGCALAHLACLWLSCPGLREVCGT